MRCSNVSWSKHRTNLNNSAGPVILHSNVTFFKTDPIYVEFLTDFPLAPTMSELTLTTFTIIRFIIVRIIKQCFSKTR
jgi:hypothetical protein